MSITPAKFEPEASNWGSFALVTYIPDPLGSFLTELRQMMPGDNRAEAHITFLPPRALSLPVEEASRKVRQKLRAVTTFELELGEVQVFPETHMLYLSVEAGSGALVNLHKLLNDAELFAEEHFEFTPHLTLGGPLSPGKSAAYLKAEQAWKAAEFSRCFVVNELVLLWQPGFCSENNWTRMSSYPLLEMAKNGSASASG